jgi:hypothetical protein
MRRRDGLYFSPKIRFLDIDPSAEAFPLQWTARIEGFYLEPARVLAASQSGFAAGVLALAALDAIARVVYGEGVGNRIVRFAEAYLPSFRSSDVAEAPYREFRNGLVSRGDRGFVASGG